MCLVLQVYIIYVPKEHRESKLDNPGARCIWVGRSRVTPNSSIHVIIPVEWDTKMNAYNMTPTQVGTNVKVNNELFPLRMGPVKDNADTDKGMSDFQNKYNLPHYKLNKDEDWSEYQTDPGHDPVMEVEMIEGKK